MLLRGTDFGKIWGASGVQGFFGEGYVFHRRLGPFGPNFDGMTFVAKTTTLYQREGNMPLRQDGITPISLFPRCVVIKPFGLHVLNSVGLSGPGAQRLFEDGRWQARTKPFFISFMSVADTVDGRLKEAEGFTTLFQQHLGNFRVPVGLQINFSCPNVDRADHSDEETIDEVLRTLQIMSGLGIPLVPKFNVLLPINVAMRVGDSQYCDALCVSNTVPYGQLPDLIPWRRIFGEESPLARRGMGDGGYSGRYLRPLVFDWYCRARRVGICNPINVGGGILSLKDVHDWFLLGATTRGSLSIGSVAILRPWRVQEIIRSANLY